MNFHASFLTVPPVFVLSQPDQRRPAQTGQLSRRELRRIIAEQLD